MEDNFEIRKAKRKHYSRKYFAAVCFLVPFLIFFVVFFLLPLFKGIYMSFFHYNIADPTDTYFVGFDNYKDFLFNESTPIIINGKPILDGNGNPLVNKNPSYYSFWFGLLYTFVFCLIIVPVSIALPLLLAVIIKKKPYGYKFFRSLIYLPSIFAVSATGAAFVYLFQGNEDGFINHLFGSDVNWFNNASTAWIVIFLLCLYNIGGNFIIIEAGLENVNKSLYEAADVDGSSAWNKFFYVTLPGIKYQLVLCVFTTFIGFMNLYGQNRVLTSGGPADLVNVERPGVTHTIIYVIQDYLTGSGKFSMAGKISAMCICLGIIIGILSIVQLIINKDKKGGNKYAKEYFETYK